MAKFDISKYWEFRVWVKSQIAQLRELLSNYQQGGGGTGGGSDFDPNGTYPNVTVGNATKASTATSLASSPALSAKGNNVTVTAGGKTSSPLMFKTINGESIIGDGNIESAGFDPAGTYPDMSVGTATDLSGRIEASPAVFTYRPSAGDKSIKDDNAFIRRVKGNSVVWNQLVPEITRTNNGVVTTFENGVFSLSGTPTSTYFNTSEAIPLVLGHTILLQVFVVANPKNVKAGFGDLNQNAYIPIATGGGVIYTASGQVNHFLGFYESDLKNIDFTGLQIFQMVVDLTAMFGAGNEPTTVEEFRALYPNSYYPYNAGELRNLVCSGIKTVGFNEFNGTYARVLPNESYYLGGSYTSIGFAKELGGATETISIPSNRIYTPTQLGYIYATGTDICINLHHTGYRDGEYEPYKEVNHSLPLSKITNGEPLRKAGSVYDEINETEYIRRVGVRGYATGDKDDATLLTDGRYTNYPLDEPIVTPIETPIDFNYYVEDFGTEEAILAENSAPFSADIVYQFNAVDNIRQNRISIQKLNDIFSGSKGEYVRADGSWGYIADLKGNFFVKPTLKRIRTGISELSDTIQIIHPYLTEHIGDAKIVLMAVKRRGGSYYDRATNAKGRRKKRKAWGELHYAAMPNTEINHNTIEMSNGASFEAWQNVILTACGRIPEGLENAREPYNVNVALEDLAEFFATNGAIFVGKTPVIRLGVALRIPNPNFIDYGNGNKMWDYNDVTGKWEYKYLYSDVAELVVKSQMLRAGGYVLGLELV